MSRTAASIACLTLALLGSATTTASAAGNPVERCAITGKGNSRLGWYMVRGGMTCAAAKRTVRLVARRGEQLEGSISHYRSWYCGGHMGCYWCANALNTGKATKLFEMRSCAPVSPGCPAHISPN